jgi:D-sedoheptulose 7-phosphate isomerase
MKNIVSSAIEVHRSGVEALADQAELLCAIAEVTAARLRDDHRLYILGNGGSAADAQHIAGEIVGRFRRDRPGWPAVALTTDTSVITSVSNDYGYDSVFERQVEALVRPGDVVWALSTSGNSENVLRAVTKARERGATVIGFTGRQGGKLAPLCDHCLCAAAETSDRIQEIHQLAYHILCHCIEEDLTTPPPNKGT